MPHATLPDRDIHYTRAGRAGGEPLLLVQGMAGHHRMWTDAFTRLLTDRFDVVAHDHRGIGESGRAEAPFTIADLADDTAALMDHLELPSAHVLGISMGGMVAQELALRHPDRVHALTLGCTYAGPGGTFEAPGPVRMVEAMRSRDAVRAIRVAYEVNLSPAYRAEKSRFTPFQETTLSVRVPAPVVAMQFDAAVRHDATDRLARVTVPTSVLHGTDDDMLLAANAEHVAGLIPGAELHLFDGVGHLFWWERPEETAAIVLRG